MTFDDPARGGIRVALVGLFAAVLSVGGLIWVGRLLVRPDAAPGRRYLGVALFAVPLMAISAGVGFVGGAFLSIALFGFDLNGTAPWWDRHLPAGGAACGALVGVAAATLLIRRWLRAETGRYPDQAADYDDRRRGPSPE